MNMNLEEVNQAIDSVEKTNAEIAEYRSMVFVDRAGFERLQELYSAGLSGLKILLDMTRL